jgi:YD repeat-containing protein
VESIAPAVIDLMEAVEPIHPTVHTRYDKVGNVVSVTDAKQNTTTNFYDANNRLVESWAPPVNVTDQIDTVERSQIETV